MATKKPLVAKAPNTQAMIAEVSKIAMARLDKDFENSNSTELAQEIMRSEIAIEHVRATYVLATVLGDILAEIEEGNSMAKISLDAL